jgi:hypothetical protein
MTTDDETEGGSERREVYLLTSHLWRSTRPWPASQFRYIVEPVNLMPDGAASGRKGATPGETGGRIVDRNPALRT